MLLNSPLSMWLVLLDMFKARAANQTHQVFIGHYVYCWVVQSSECKKQVPLSTLGVCV